MYCNYWNIWIYSLTYAFVYHVFSLIPSLFLYSIDQVFLLCRPSQVVQLLSHVRLFATPWIAAHQASLSITNSRSSLKLMPIESVMPSSHLILCPPLLLPPIPPSIRVFSNESTLHMRWPKYWSFSFSINEHPGLISLGWTGWISLQSKDSQESLPTPQFKSINFFGTKPSSQSNSHIHTWPLEKP